MSTRSIERTWKEYMIKRGWQTRQARPWLSMHRRLIVSRQDQISFGLTKMFCIILKHHSWEPEVEVIHSMIVYFILLRIQMWAQRQLQPAPTVLIRYDTKVKDVRPLIPQCPALFRPLSLNNYKIIALYVYTQSSLGMLEVTYKQIMLNIYLFDNNTFVCKNTIKFKNAECENFCHNILKKLCHLSKQIKFI